MEPFTIGLGNRWWIRAFSRNPLVRRSDRIESLVYVFAVLLTVVAMPIAGAIGTVVHDERTRLYAEEAETKHQVVAVATEEGQVVVEEKGIAFNAEAKWDDAGGIHRGIVAWPNRAKVGDRHNIWVNTEGQQVGPPYSASQAASEAVGIALAVWLGVTQASAAAAYLVRRWLDHGRYAQWEREINAARDNNGRRNRQS